jgi:hypothetical protein
MEVLWLRRARRGARLGLVLLLVGFPFTLWELTKPWHAPILYWLARHPWHALAGYKPVIAQQLFGLGAILFMLLGFLSTWWLTTAPPKGEAADRWRWPLLRWGFFGLALAYPAIVVASNALAGKHGASPRMGDVGGALEVVTAVTLYVIFTELSDARASVLSLVLVGVAILRQLTSSAQGGAGEGTIGTVLLVARTSIDGYLLWRLGWRRQRTVDAIAQKQAATG